MGWLNYGGALAASVFLLSRKVFKLGVGDILVLLLRAWPTGLRVADISALMFL